MNTELSDSTTRRRLEQFEDGSADIPGMTVGEWMQLSLLSLFDKKAANRDTLVMYKGVLYNTHICITYARPPENTDNLNVKH